MGMGCVVVVGGVCVYGDGRRLSDGQLMCREGSLRLLPESGYGSIYNGDYSEILNQSSVSNSCILYASKNGGVKSLTGPHLSLITSFTAQR
jgi:hypothetical protein